MATGHKPTAKTMDNDPCLPDDLNEFFSRFEVKNIRAAHMQEQSSVQHVLQLTGDSVKRVFTKINPRKPAGPDQMLRVLRAIKGGFL